MSFTPPSVPSLFDSESLRLVQKMAALAAAMEAFEEVTSFPTTGWLPDAFFDRLDELYATYDTYIDYNITASQLKIFCKPACTRCCKQMVHGTYSFEIINLYRHLRGRIDYPRIHNTFLAYAKEFESMLAAASNDMAYARTGETPFFKALRVFAARLKPCPLLIEHRCSEYAARPVSCRMYHSLTDPVFCVTSMGNNFNLDLPESVGQKLARLSDRLAFPHSEFLAHGLVVFAVMRQFRPWAPP